MEKGGRFYGGWWQSLPSLYRPHITIDGYKTCEVDYSAIALRIIYAQAGTPYPTEDDPYDIGLPEWKGSKDSRRPLVKTYVNALINDEGGNYRLPVDEQQAIGITYSELKDLVLNKHKSIAHLFSTGVGLEAQYIDSQIAQKVMLVMMEEGLVVLPIHDSFIVRLGFQQWVEEVMEVVSLEVLGSRVTTKADGARLPKHFGISKTEYSELSKEPEDNLVHGANTWEEIKSRSGSLMSKYLTSWEVWRSNQ